MHIDGKVFLKDLREKVALAGAKLIQRHFSTKEELLTLEEPILINCMSLGSRELFDDSEFVPVRGQLVYFEPQEGIDYLYYENVPGNPTTWVTIYPWSDRLILNGVYEVGEEERIVVPETIDMIIDNAQRRIN